MNYMLKQCNIVFDSLENGTLVVDEECVVWSWNKWLEINTGIEAESIIEKNLELFYPEVDYKGLQRKIRTTLRLNTPTFYDASLSNRFIQIPRHKITSSLLSFMQLQVTIAPYIPAEKKVMISIHDISDLHELKMTLQQRMKEIALLNSELQQDKQIINANLMIVKTDSGCEIVDATEAFCDFFGYTKGELIGGSLSRFYALDAGSDDFEQMKEVLRNKHRWSGEVEIITKNNDCVWMDTVISPFVDEYGEIISYTAIYHDITDKKRIEMLSVTDPLTKLFNRQKFDDVCRGMLMRRHWTKEYTFGLIIIDVDYFKKVNDTYGHQAGDSVLIEVSDILSQTVRTGDVLARWGGEEFVVLTPDVDSGKVLYAAEKLRRAIEMLEIPAVGKVTASFGVTVFVEGDTQESMLHRSDQALYRAKEKGRNRVESIFS
ncbi:MAG: sensor domain-containing diguanylate cyclase [Sulfuricurvum sp.]|jgi:diguanylate cyclase (GGDEF)-like protein/PAS domain S-box-containing protein|uniref:sensor domain-containing diguanylate cyclase n=1 Tax=Sulfuricurvum sp. TaxID=2025608 RepID=UPI0025EEFFED|nr:sensor domain-containing diguanylate cyclase [Sulfuricurvum sp.]MCK9373083.1 sensor domain-containing diguanylate cyclase [Sulfuricurvum sp.]